MTSPINRDVFRSTFEHIGRKRMALATVLELQSLLHDVSPPISPADLFAYLHFADASDPIVEGLARLFADLDYTTEGEWVSGTERSTRARREAVYRALQLTGDQSRTCDELFPRYPIIDSHIVITSDREWKRWYSPERRRERSFYWNAYRRQLEDKNGWNAKNLAVLEATTTDVVERLADPTNPEPFQSKGLVVGYVQSGKTAHYTGVIAKAADAGYRLIIVLAGTLNILREQTQRRLDKELLGWELVRDDYERDPEALDFLRHGFRPSERNFFDWERLTLAREDFQRLNAGISALEFRCVDPRLPFFHPSNVHRERARLIVVKKYSTVLANLVDALERTGNRISLDGVPALIIDDESDQASVNTHRPKKDEEKERKERTVINRQIIRLLQMLKRAQYIGYTATPFANVFIDPDDASDLYPNDFIVALPKPDGYMGVADFHDETPAEEGDFRHNKNAFVREVQGSDAEVRNLPQAIDAFVLSGAIKLYREARGRRHFKHHTMLIHHSAYTNVHKSQADHVERLFRSANYLGGGTGVERLRKLWDSDYSKVSLAKAELGSAVPSSFRELEPFIGECCRRIEEGDKPVLVVNGDNKDDAPNFEQGKVWKIIVGGTKLSRGYTVEGLTVTYYRRRAGAADTLMQMGRWFGYRAGYKDLVRLYIGTREPLNKKETKFINLYDAFVAACHDEEEFRADLRRYSSLEEGERITPKQVPPLVPQHMLPPTSTNKRYNAVLEFENYGSKWSEPTVATSSKADRQQNERLMRSLLAPVDLQTLAVQGQLSWSGSTHQVDFSVLLGEIGTEPMISFLRDYRWEKSKEHTLSRVLDFLKGVRGDPHIRRWLFVAPLTRSARSTWKAADVEFPERRRAQPLGTRYGVYSEPAHRSLAEYLTCVSPTAENRLSHEAARLRKPDNGVFVFYPVRSEQEAISGAVMTMAFGLQFPSNNLPHRLQYSVRRTDQPDAVTVDT